MSPLEETLEECAAIKGQFKRLKERVLATEELLKSVREKNSQDMAVVLQKNKTQEQVLKYLRERVEECELENQAFHEEIKTVREQKRVAEEKVNLLHKEMARREEERTQEEKEFKEELEALRSQCVKLKEPLQALQGEIRALKERSGKDFEREREALLEEMRALKRRADGVNQLEVLKKELEEKVKDCQKRLDDTLQIKQQNEQELRSFKEGLKQKELLLEEAKSKILRFQQEKYDTEKRFSEHKTVLETLETELKMAKLHLAKKLKETNQIQEFNEALEKEKAALLAKLQDKEESYKALEEAVKNAEKKSEEEASHQNKRELAKSEEIVRLKKEIERLKEKNKMAEDKIAELISFKEKHTQLQGLIQELGGAMKEPEKVAEKFVVKPTLPTKKRKSADLFDNAPPSPYYKKNLFE